MADYVRDNPQFIVKGFIKADMLGALDGNVNDSSSDEEDEDEYDDDADFKADTDESDLEDTDLENPLIALDLMMIDILNTNYIACTCVLASEIWPEFFKLLLASIIILLMVN